MAHQQDSSGKSPSLPERTEGPRSEESSQDTETTTLTGTTNSDQVRLLQACYQNDVEYVSEYLNQHSGGSCTINWQLLLEVASTLGNRGIIQLIKQKCSDTWIIDDWGKKHGLSHDTICVMKDKKLDTVDVIKELKMQDLNSMDLRTRGERQKIIRAALPLQIEHIKAKFPRMFEIHPDLTNETIKVLYDEGYTSKDIISTLTRKNIQRLNITHGQKALLLREARIESISKISTHDIEDAIEKEDIEFFIEAVKHDVKQKSTNNVPKCKEHGRQRAGDLPSGKYDMMSTETKDKYIVETVDNIVNCITNRKVCGNFQVLDSKNRNILFDCEYDKIKRILETMKGMEMKLAGYREERGRAKEKNRMEMEKLQNLIYFYRKVINHKDQNGDTPFLYHCRKRKWKETIVLFESSFNDKFASDKMGNNALFHFASMKCNANGFIVDEQGAAAELDELVKTLLSCDNLVTSKNINHQSILHVASIAGNKMIIENICKSEHLYLIYSKDKCDLIPLACSRDQDTYKILLKYTNLLLETSDAFLENLEDQKLIFNEQNVINQNMKPSSNNLQDILKKKGVGLIEPEDEKELEETKNAIHFLIKCLAAGAKIRDKDLEFDWEQMGSVKEGTKIGMPNEFDILMKLVKLANLISMEPINATKNEETDLVYLNLKHPESPNSLSDLFVDEKLSVDKLFQRHYRNLQNLMAIPELWQICTKLYKAVNRDIAAHKTEISNLTVKHRGKCFPFPDVDVDLVPGIELKNKDGDKKERECCNGKIKDESNVRNEFIDKYENTKLIVAKKFHYFHDNEFIFRLTKSQEEAAMMISMGKIRDIYKICKIVRQPAYCGKADENKGDVDKQLTSYILKNTVMFLFANKEFEECSHAEGALKVYKEILNNLNNDNIPMFFLPNQNILYMNQRKDNKDKDAPKIKVGDANTKPVGHDGFCKKKDNMIYYCKKIIQLLESDIHKH